MKNSTLRLGALFVFGIYALYGCVLIPLMEYVASDWALLTTVLYDVLDVLLNVTEVLGAGATFGLLIHAVYSHTAKKALPFYLVAGGGILFKYVSSLLAVSIVRGSLDLTGDFSSLIVSVLIELAECAITVFLAHVLTQALFAENKAMESAARTLHETIDTRTRTFPFQSLFSRTNALQRTAFWNITLLTVVRWISFIIADISYAGMYAPSEMPTVLLYWLLLILIPSFLGYLLALGYMLLAERIQKK